MVTAALPPWRVREGGVQSPQCGTGMAAPQIVAYLVLIPPKILKPSCRQLRVFDRVLDVAMPQEKLNGPRILLVIGELIAAPMPELVRVHREPQPGDLSGLGDHLAHARIRQWPFTLGEKHIGCVSRQAFEFA